MSSRATLPLRVALLGAWHVHVDDHAREANAHPGAELAYVWDEDRARGSEVAARWGVAYIGGTDVREVLRAHPVGAVMVTVAPVRKQATIAAALDAGVHVLTEKPLAIREADALDLQRRALASGRQLWLSMPFLRAPATVVAANAVRDGSLGTVTSVRVRLGIDGAIAGWLPDRFLDGAQAPGGVLTDLACHPLYIVDRIVGAEPVRTSYYGARVRSDGVEDNAVVIHQYASGTIAVIESTFVDIPGGSFMIEVVGTAGALRWNGARGVLETALDGGAWEPRSLGPEPGHPAADFLDAVIGGAPVGATFAEAAQLSRRLEGILGPTDL